ncbi:hypothetical protein Efla_002028 [Eimeria flavescens]
MPRLSLLWRALLRLLLLSLASWAARASALQLSSPPASAARQAELLLPLAPAKTSTAGLHAAGLQQSACISCGPSPAGCPAFASRRTQRLVVGGQRRQAARTLFSTHTPPAAAAAAAAKATGRPAAAAAEEPSQDVLFPLGLPPLLSSRAVESGRSAADLEEAKQLIEKEMWRLYDNHQQQQQQQQKMLSKEQVQQLVGFSRDFCDSAKVSGKLTAKECLHTILSLFHQCVTCQTHVFQPYSPAQRQPLDFASWALRVWEPLIDSERSNVQVSDETLSAIRSHLASGGNVFLLSNHQTEPDPLVVRLVFKRKGFSDLYDQLVAVAGYRVRSDVLSVPFSMGCNMICVHSKKHLASSAAALQLQREQNVRAMHALQQLLQEGGALVWVAPSGGRDRPDSNGFFSRIDRFDEKAVQSFCLLAKRAKEITGRETLFCPLAVYTAPICPPPNEVKTELGEARRCKFSPIGIALGSLLPPAAVSSQLTQQAQREADALYQSVLIHPTDPNTHTQH